MQKLQITVSEDELRFLEGVRATGFSSVQEVIRCAALSYLESKAGDGRPPDGGEDGESGLSREVAGTRSRVLGPGVRH